MLKEKEEYNIEDSSLLEEYEFVGVWWLPEKPEEKLGGRLTYHPQRGLALKIWGEFSVEETPEDQTFVYPIVLGRTDEGKKISLLDVEDYYVLPNTTHSTTINKSIYPRFGILGVLIPTLKDFKVRKASVKFFELDDWSNKPIVTVEPVKSDTLVHQYLVTNKTQTFLDTEIVKIDGKIVMWNGSPTGSISMYNRKGLKIYTSHYISLFSKSEQTVQWYVQVIEEIENLLTFLTGEPMPPVRVFLNVFIKNEPNSTYSLRSDGYSTSTVLFYKPKVSRLKEPDFTWGYLYHFEDLENSFPQIINRYFERDGDFKTAFDLLLLSLSGVSSYLDFQFLPLMQALEAYCRTRRDDIKETYLSEGEYKALQEGIEAAMGKQADTALGSKIKEFLDKANKKVYTLSEQLQFVVEQLPEDIRNLFHESPGEFIKQLKDTRDYYTHRGGRSERKALKEEDLALANLRLWLLITALISLDLGIPEQIVVQGLENSANYTRIRLMTIANGQT